MKLVTAHILRQLCAPALLAALVIGFVTVSSTIQHEVESLVEDVPFVRITLADVLRIAFYAAPTLLTFIIPITFLLSILLTFGRMARFSETTALKAAGIPLKRVVAPVILTGAVLSAVCFVVQDQAQPWAYGKLMHLVSNELPQRTTLDRLPTGIVHSFGAWRVYVGERDEAGVMYDFWMLAPGADGASSAHFAQRALLTGTRENRTLELYEGTLVRAGARTMGAPAGFNHMSIPVPGLAARPFRRQQKGLSLAGLLVEYDGILKSHAVAGDALAQAAARKKVMKQRKEIAKRLAYPLMCVAVSFVGAPLAARTRRTGRSHAFGAGFLLVVAYVVLRKQLEPDAEVYCSLAETVLRAQIPNLVLCALGSVLVWRVDRV